jgi:hypothetical protein
MTVFVWAKMQAEAGETLDRIVQRKEAEREHGSGLFWWGIGGSLATAAVHAGSNGDLPVLFSRMLSKPKKKDAAPAAVCVWERWQTKNGREGQIPLNVLVTGGSLGGSHYALVCHSSVPLKLQDHGAFDPQNCRTMARGKVPGASQVTSLLRDLRPGTHESGPYRLGFRATLVDPWAVKLTEGRQLSERERDTLRQYKEGDDWMRLVSTLRKRN